MSLLTNSISLRDTLTAKYVKLQETGGANKITLQAPVAFTSYSLTLPSTVGNAGEVLSTDGAGGTSWITQSSGGGTASFADDTIEIYNATVASKLLHFSCANIAANTTRNFVMTDTNIDLGTLPTQLLLTTSTPQFTKLGIGQAAGANQLEVTGNMKVGTAGGLTVGAATPSAAQWAYLAALDQGLASSNSVTFTTATASTSAKWIETGGGADEITLVAPAAANYSLALPTGAGIVDYILATNGAGQLSWASQGSGSGTAAYSDSTFEIYNSATPTKKITFLVNSAAGTRTITVPDTNVNLTNTPTQAVATTSTPQFAQLGVGQAAGAHQLDVTGAIKISAAGGLTIGAVTPSAAQWGYLAGLDQSLATSATAAFAKVGLGAGSVSAPALYFNSHTSSGLYRIGSNNIGLSISGAKSLDFSSAGVGISGLTYLTNGTLGAPSLGFSAAPTTGLYRIASDNIGISVGGTKKWDLATTASTVAGARIKARAVYGSIYKRGTTKYVDNCISNWNYCAGVNSAWNSIVWSSEKSLFVAVSRGVSPYIITSPNGRQWTTRTAPVSLNWFSVCYGGNQFVSVATNGTGNGVMTSSDGITWISRAPVSDQSWQSVAYGAGYYCSVSYDGAVYRIMNSTDAITWNSVATPVLNQWYGLCYGSASVGFVAVSYNGSSNRIMSSVNSTSWTSRTSSNGTYYAVAYSPELNLYCAVGDSGAITTSSDAVTWVTRTSPYSASFRGICWSSELGIFLATTNGNKSTFIYSYDGITWYGGNINASAGTKQSQFIGVAWSPENNVFVAMGYGSSYYGPFYSYDPRANLALVDSDYRLSSYRLSAANAYWPYIGQTVWSPWYRRWFGGAYNGSTMYATYPLYEGPIAWQMGTNFLDGARLAGIATKIMNWQMGANTRIGYTSGDPTGWSSVSNPNDGCYGLAYGLLTGVFSACDTNGRVWYVSGSGTSWTSTTGTGNIMRSMAYSPQLNKYVCVADSGRFGYSSNGSSYTTLSTMNMEYDSIAWSPELAIFCAVSYTFAYVAISSDGQNWEYTTLNVVSPATYTGFIMWVADTHMFIISGGPADGSATLYPSLALKSYDGRNWSHYYSPISWRWMGYSAEYGQLCFSKGNTASSARYLMGYTVAKYAY